MFHAAGEDYKTKAQAAYLRLPAIITLVNLWVPSVHRTSGYHPKSNENHNVSHKSIQKKI
jgi:hypothetical protein